MMMMMMMHLILVSYHPFYHDDEDYPYPSLSIIAITLLLIMMKYAKQAKLYFNKLIRYYLTNQDILFCYASFVLPATFTFQQSVRSCFT
jgi:hypothetical protein